ncbi:MAG: hypothetical protein LR000_01695 [Candidatus Pacebacteria bacterium]|nr:hypothetical protein [Candidatus Paceibacterota bacterium]
MDKKILVGLLIGAIIFLIIALIIGARRAQAPSPAQETQETEKTQQLPLPKEEMQELEGEVIEVPVPVKIEEK